MSYANAFDLLVLLGLLSVLVVNVPLGNVTRAGLTRFARRESVRVTPSNGPALIAYLATRRRWRFGVLLVAGAVDLMYAWWPRDVADQGLRPDLLLVALLVAMSATELRTDPFAGEAVGAASLRRRRLTDYLPEPVLLAVGTAWLVAAGFGAFVLLRISQIGSGPDYTPAVLVLVIAAAAALGWAGTARRVLRRPQPALPRDLVAADEAMRSAALHGLAGWAVAFAGCLGVGLLDSAPAGVLDVEWHTVWVIKSAVVLVSATAGALLAGRPASARRRSIDSVALPA